ncbi:MAG TPA: ABC transporter substrate-binding protein [Pyrinomonadaceae bacterium]|jgi:iron complex transport system substrate-binding protein|nr:ABC transporter substrate-binding protein [Pyrinomonadaceae bacterium]
MKRRSENFRRAYALAFASILAALVFAVSCGGGARTLSAKSGKPERIISLTPSTTEILYGVGAFDRVVAVSDYCTYPADVAKLPRAGGWNNPNMEQIAGLRPDLVIFSDQQAQFVKDKVEAAGIRTLSVPSQTLEDAYKSIELVGQATGEEEAARNLLERTRASVETVRLKTERLPRLRVLCVVDRVPGTLRDLYTAGEQSFIAQLIREAGGEPISPPSRANWGKMQKEAVVSIDPDVVIDLMMHKSEGSFDEDTLAVWRELSSLRAVREGRVYTLREETALHPSQFVGDTARRFAELIHPEAFEKK